MNFLEDEPDFLMIDLVQLMSRSMLEMLEMLDLDILDFDNHHIAASATTVAVIVEKNKHDSDNSQTEKLDFQQSEINKK